MPRLIAHLSGLISLNEAAMWPAVAARYCYPLCELSRLHCGSIPKANRIDCNHKCYTTRTISEHEEKGSYTDGASSRTSPPAGATPAATAGSCTGTSKVLQPQLGCPESINAAKHMLQHFSCDGLGSMHSTSRSSAWGFNAHRPFTTSCQQAYSNGYPPADDLTLRIEITDDLQQLQQLLSRASQSSPLTAAQAATAYCQAVQLAAKQVTVAAVQPILDLLQPAWQLAVQSATIEDLSDALYSWSKLGYTNEQLWAATLAAVPALCKQGNGQELSNIAYAIAATAEANKGVVPGVSREEADEVMRAVTHELVIIVQNASLGQGRRPQRIYHKYLNHEMGP